MESIENVACQLEPRIDVLTDCVTQLGDPFEEITCLCKAFLDGSTNQRPETPDENFGSFGDVVRPVRIEEPRREIDDPPNRRLGRLIRTEFLLDPQVDAGFLNRLVDLLDARFRIPFTVSTVMLAESEISTMSPRPVEDKRASTLTSALETRSSLSFRRARNRATRASV